MGLHVLGHELHEPRREAGGGLGPELVRVARVAPNVGDQERVYAGLPGGHGLQYEPLPASRSSGDAFGQFDGGRRAYLARRPPDR